MRFFRALVCGITMAAATTGAVTTAAAQEIKISRGGFDYVVPVHATGEERNNQSNLWIFEIHMKSMRMIELPLTNPKTGEKKNEVVHYIVYKAVNRVIERKRDTGEKDPVNSFDDPPGPDIFVPSALLVTEDDAQRQVYKDEIYFEAQRAIEKREKLKLVNSVQAMKPVPTPVANDVNTDESAYHGVMIFRNVAPDADYYTVFLTGFSNGYKLVKGPVAYGNLVTLANDKKLRINHEVWNGDFKQDWRAAGDFEHLFDSTRPQKPDVDRFQWYYTVSPEESDAECLTWRKTLMMKFWRPGDRFERFEGEIRMQGDPTWIYRPDANKPKNPLTKTAQK